MIMSCYGTCYVLQTWRFLDYFAFFCLLFRDGHSRQKSAAHGGKCQPHCGYVVPSSWSGAESGTDAEHSRCIIVVVDVCTNIQCSRAQWCSLLLHNAFQFRKNNLIFTLTNHFLFDSLRNCSLFERMRLQCFYTYFILLFNLLPGFVRSVTTCAIGVSWYLQSWFMEGCSLSLVKKIKNFTITAKSWIHSSVALLLSFYLWVFDAVECWQ